MNLGVPSKDTGWRMSDVAGDQNWRGTLKKEQMMASPTAQRRRLPRNTILAQETVRGPPASAAAGASSTQAGVDGAAAASPEVPPAASPVPLPRWGGVVIRAPPQQPRSSRRGDLSARSSARGIAAAYLSARSGASQSQTSRSYATSRTGMTDATDFKHLSNHRRALEKRLEELDELIELQDGGLAEADAEMKGQRSMHARRQTEVTIEYK